MPPDEPSLASQLLRAQEAERMRIAKELHGGVGQQIAALSLIASTLKRRIPSLSDEAKEQFYLIHLKLSGIATSLQRLSHRLYPAVLEHSGIVAGLEVHCKALSSSGIEVEFHPEGEFDDLTEDEALCLYRVAEGALEDISGSACVRLRVVEDGVELSVSGAVGERESFELAVIRERAELAGGEAEIRCGPSGAIRFTLPRGRS